MMLHTTTSCIPRHFRIQNAINEISDLIMGNVGEKGIIYHVSYSDSVPDSILSDSQKYKLIIFNLLTNAVKYTAEGSINVHIAYNKKTGELTTSVEDTGIGMSKETQDRLFLLYGNIEQATEINPQGMGLGLTICKKLSNILGGDITVKSTLAEGSCFIFTIKLPNENEDTSFHIPMEKLECEARRDVRLFLSYDNSLKREPIEEEKQICDCNPVLVVDDEPTNRLVLSSYLKSMHIEVDQAANGLIALQKVSERERGACCKKYKLILMDINMPEMDGAEATRRLMKIFSEKTAIAAPILAVTVINLNSSAEYTRLLEAGFTDVRNK